jgi:histidine triad (HIT) family protein
MSIAQELAVQFGIQGGYRLLTNNGADAGQTIFHLHFHLIGGRPLGAMG